MPSYKLHILPYLLCALSIGQASNIQWKDVEATNGELDFLRQLADYSKTTDTKKFLEPLENLDDIDEIHQQAWVSILIDQWIRLDAEELHRVLIERWDNFPPIVHNTYLQLAIQLDPKSIAQLVFEQSGGPSTYQEEVLYLLAGRNPQLAVKYITYIEDVESRGHLANSIIYSWMEADFDRAMNWALENRELVDIKQLIQNLMYREGPDEQDHLLDLWKSLPKDVKTAELQSQLANNLAYQNPELALEFLDGLPDSEKYSLTHRIMDRLAENNSPKAAELLRELPLSQIPNLSTLKKVMLEWGLREPEQAETWARSIPDPKLREGAMLRLNTALGMIDPQLAVDQALAEPNGVLRTEMIRNAALVICKDDLATGLAWVDSLPESSGKQRALVAITYLSDRYSTIDMLNLALDMSPGQSSQNFINSLFGKWCSGNIRDAAEWYMRLPESEQIHSREHNISRKLCDREPMLALDYMFSETTPSRVREKIFSNYINQYKDYPDLIEPMLEGVKPEHVKTFLTYSSIEKLAAYAPTLGLELTTELEPRLQQRTQSRIISEWAKKNPAGLASYLSSNGKNLEEMGAYPHNYRILASNWAGKDRDSTIRWIENINAPELREQAEYGYMENLAKTAPATAFAELQAAEGNPDYKDHRTRNRLYNEMISTWAYYDPAAAREAVEASTIKNKSNLFKTINNLKAKP